MTVLKSVLRDIIRPVLRPILRGGDDAITRFFTTLAASGSMHYTIPTVTLPGDFEIPFNVYPTDFDNVYAIIGNSSGQSGGFIATLNTSGVVRFNLGGVSHDYSTIPLTVNKLNSGLLKRVGTTTTLTVNGVSEAITTSSASVSYDQFGAIGASFFPNSIPANIGFTDAGTPIRFYPLDENFGETPIVKNSLAVLGPEKIVNGSDLIDTNGWTAVNSTLAVADGGLRVIDDGAFSTGYQSFTTAIGTTYKIRVTRDATSSGSNSTVGYGSTIPAGLNYGEFEEVFTSNKTREWVFTATTTISYIGLGSQGTASATYSNITVKQADGYGTAINISESDLFTLQSNGDYLGVERVVNGDFSDGDTGWGVGAGWTIASGVASQSGDTSNLSSTGISISEDNRYLTSFDIDFVIPQGKINASVGATFGVDIAFSSGDTSFSQVITAGAAGSFFLRGNTSGSGFFMGNIDNVSVKQILEQA